MVNQENNTIIFLSGISKVFRDGFWRKKIVALENVSLEVKSGEILGYLGPNGAGKTTTIKILTNLIRPSQGEVEIKGLPASNEQARKFIGYLPEQPYFYNYLTAMEFLIYCGNLSGVWGKACRNRAKDLLARFGLEKNYNIKLRNFSRGMLQRIGIAQALIHDPQVIILDEPMEGLDPIGRRLVKDIIMELKSQGKTVFFSSHILEDVEAICDRVAILITGHLRAVDTLQNILGQQESIIDIDFIIESDNDSSSIIKQFPATKKHGKKLIFSTTNEEEVFSVVDKIKEKKGHILTIQHRRTTLEDIFLKQVSMEKNE